jgi:hypothetical protein
MVNLLAHTLTDIGAQSSAQETQWRGRQQNSPSEPYPNEENAPTLTAKRGMIRRRDETVLAKPWQG